MKAEIQDDFKIGLSFANKNINLYTAFTNSDIIIGNKFLPITKKSIFILSISFGFKTCNRCTWR